MRGRPRKATSRRSASAVTAPGGRPTPPKWVADDAELLELWEALVGHLESMGSCSPAFGPTLEAIAARTLEMRTCEEAIEQDGRFQKAPSGRIYAHPAVGQHVTHRTARERLLLELGLSPASRSRVKPVEGGGAKSDNPLLLRLAKKGAG